MRLGESARFLERHAVAFPLSGTDAALLAIALHALAVIAEEHPGIVPNLKRGVVAFLEEAINA